MKTIESTASHSTVHGFPRQRILQSDISRDDMDTPSRDGDDDSCFQAFRRETELKHEAKCVKAEKQSAWKKRQRFSEQKQWRQQLKRTQEYLGLCNSHYPTAGSMEAVCSVLENLRVTARAVENNPSLPIHGDLGLLPKAFDSSVIFISIDVEAFEFNQKLVTEIGISTLDTGDLLGLQPGAKGSNWAAKIRSRHFRIREHGHRLNKVYVEGCPDKFDFGQSEWIYEQDAISVLEGCFNPSRSSLSVFSTKPCKVILVAHDIAGDLKYLTGIGFDVTQRISDCIDTSVLYKVARREIRQTALSTLLLQYGIAAKHLHNAGNDASYTLRVMIAIAVDDVQNKRTAEEWEVEKRSRIKVACEMATTKVCAELEGWSTSEDEKVANSSTSSFTVDQRQRGKVPDIIQEQGRYDAKSIIERANPKRQGRPEYRTHIDGTLSDVAVQDNPGHQDVSQGPTVPSYKTSGRRLIGKQDDGYHDGGRGRGRGQGRGRGRRQGRESAGDRVRGWGRGEGRGQGRG